MPLAIPTIHHPPTYLVSACLAGLCSRYDGRTRPNKTCLQKLRNGIWIPFCPEQMGGLPTPRVAADITTGDGYDVLAGTAKVLTRDGLDVTPQFIQGAKQALLLAQSQPISAIFLKSASPSCGITGKIGVTAALLTTNDFSLIEF